MVDVWDALLSDRPYRKALPRDRVVAYLSEESGVLFDPAVVDIFLGIMEDYVDLDPPESLAEDELSDRLASASG